jgi:hypothetical protein
MTLGVVETVESSSTVTSVHRVSEANEDNDSSVYQSKNGTWVWAVDSNGGGGSGGGLFNRT